MDNDIFQLLYESKQAHALVGMFTDSSDYSTFELGWIIDISEDFYILMSLDEHGDFASNQLGRNVDVHQISLASNYISNFERLHKNMPGIEANTPNQRADIHALLQHLQKAGEILTLDTYRGQAITGFAIEILDTAIIMDELTVQGLYNATIALPLTEVRGITWSGKSEKSIRRLRDYASEFELEQTED